MAGKGEVSGLSRDKRPKDCTSSLRLRGWCPGAEPLVGGLPLWKPVIFFPLPLPQLMQQQAALMASVAQGGYLNPMAAFAAAQMQQMAALNMNGLAAAPMTPTSGEPVSQSLTWGKNSRTQAWASLQILVLRSIVKTHGSRPKYFVSKMF